MVLLFCGVRLGVGEELLSVSGWGDAGWEGMGDWCLACGVDGGWRFSGRRMWVVEYFGPSPILPVPLLSLYFPYPSDQLSSSHTSRTPSCPLFPTVTTLMHPRPDAESCCSISHPVAGCWSLPQSVSDLSAGLSQGRLVGWLGAWPVQHSLGYGSWVGICHSRHSFPYNDSWRLRNAGASRKLLEGSYCS